MNEVNIKINITENCIMNCRYCPQKHEKISFKKELVKPLVAFLKGIDRKLKIDFFGGEPLLSYDTIKYFVEECKHQKIPIEDFSLITNGILSNKEKIDFLAKNKFQLQFSIDGTEETHLKNRRSDRISVNSHKKILATIDYMRKKGYLYRVYAVFHTNTAHKLDETVRFLLGLVGDWKQISINPTIGFEWGEKEFDGLNKALNRLIKRDPQNFYLYKKILYKKETDLICNSVYIDHYGDVYPTNLFAYKNLCKPIHLTEIKDPKETLNMMIKEQENIKDWEYDKEMKDQFKIIRFVNNFFDEHEQKLRTSKNKGTESNIKNKTLDANCIFEKKKWISITGLCNNNCIFCLDKDRLDKFHRNSRQIKKEIKEAKEQGNTKLIISGGDPTIHPNIIDFVKYAKELGYDKIQVVTNGRMFASKDFTDKMIAAGLDEVTFSIHGYNPEMHDSLTNVPGSFKQVLRGVKNVFSSKKGMIVNTDTCITNSNYESLPKIIKFIVEKVGIKEVNLMSMVPQGNAWKYRDKVLYDYEKVAPYVHKVINYCVANDVVLWLSRFPAEYLEGYEEFIEDPYKMVDDVRGLGGGTYEGKNIPECKGDKCEYCGIKTICGDIVKINQKFIKGDCCEQKDKNKTISITKNNFRYLLSLVKQNEDVTFELVKPQLRIQDYKKIVPEIKQAMPYIKSAIKKTNSAKISGIPPCFFIEDSDCNLIFDQKIFFIEDEPELKQEYIQNGKLDYIKIAEDLTKCVKIKKSSCKDCMFTEHCQGVYQNYIRIYGFKELHPIKKKEVRINLECNQDCPFCNTDSDAENVITQEEGVYNQIKQWSYGGVNYLVISGKEPTLDKNLIKYIKLAKEKGYYKIELQTNAVKCADASFSKNLSDAGLTDAFVSLHAHKPEISDEITCARGTFEKTVKGVKNLVSSGINITINIVINSINYKILLEHVRFVTEELGVKNIVFSFVSPVCNALKNPSIIPKISQITPYLNTAMDYLIRKGIGFSIASRCGIPFCFLKGYEQYSDEFREPSRWKNHANKIFLESCNECEYKEKCNGIWSKYIEIHGESEFVKSKEIRHIDINLGKVCNNRCIFCMVHENKNTQNRFVPLEQIKKELKKFSKKNYEGVGFLGGEPTIHQNILEIVKYAQELGYKEIHLVSNGRRYEDENFLREIIKAGVNHFSVSIHHYKQREEDKLTRAKGGFYQKINGIKNLAGMVKAGLIKNKVTILCVINKHNYKELDKIIKFYDSLGINKFRFSFIRPEGRANDNFAQLVPKYSDFAKKIPSLIKLAKSIGAIITLGDIPLCIIPDYETIESRIGENSDKPSTVVSFDNLKPDAFQKETFEWEERRINDLKIKSDKCGGCKYNTLCEGPWKEYVNRFGFEEFKPVK